MAKNDGSRLDRYNHYQNELAILRDRIALTKGNLKSQTQTLGGQWIDTTATDLARDERTESMLIDVLRVHFGDFDQPGG